MHCDLFGARSYRAVASIRLASTSELKDYAIPWAKTGIGIDSEGRLPSPRRGNGLIFLSTDLDTPGAAPATGGKPAVLHKPDFRVTDETLPAYMDPIRPLLNSRLPEALTGILGYGARSPIYTPPAGFVTRLGTQPSHFFFSGTFASNGVRIGFG